VVEARVHVDGGQPGLAAEHRLALAAVGVGGDAHDLLGSEVTGELVGAAQALGALALEDAQVSMATSHHGGWEVTSAAGVLGLVDHPARGHDERDRRGWELMAPGRPAPAPA